MQLHHATTLTNLVSIVNLYNIFMCKEAKIMENFTTIYYPMAIFEKNLKTLAIFI